MNYFEVYATYRDAVGNPTQGTITFTALTADGHTREPVTVEVSDDGTIYVELEDGPYEVRENWTNGRKFNFVLDDYVDDLNAIAPIGTYEGVDVIKGAQGIQGVPGYVNLESGAITLDGTYSPGGSANAARVDHKHAIASPVISSVGSGSIAITARGTTGQSADLQQWQTVSGTKVAAVASDGVISTNSGGGAASLNGSGLAITRTVAYIDNQQVNGTTIARTSRVTTSDTEVMRWTTGGLVINTAGNIPAGNVPFIVKGSPTQSANLTQWQDSTGTPLAVITASGALNFYRPLAATSAQPSVNSPQLTMQSSGWSGTAPIEVQARIVNARQGGNGVGARLTIGENANPDMSALAINLDGTRTVSIGSGFGETAGQLYVQSTSTTRPAAYIRAAGSSTADIAQFVNGAGTARVTLGSEGEIRSGTQISATTWSASTVPLVAKAASSQTADIQQWNDSSGTPRLKVTNVGELESTIAGFGVYLKSPDGTRYKVTVANGGALAVTAA